MREAETRGEIKVDENRMLRKPIKRDQEGESIRKD